MTQDISGDRELMELAAKAAGIPPGTGIDSDGGYVRIEGSGGDLRVVKWSPLTDDGDALRLAVSMELGVEIDYGPSAEIRVKSMNFSASNGSPFVELREPCGDGVNEFIATRRAIVRAAAEIGRNM